MAWQDSIRIAGSPGVTPAGEVFQGIGANSLKGDRNLLSSALVSWATSTKAFLLDCKDWIIANMEAYEEGDDLNETLPSELSLNIGTPTNAYFKSNSWNIAQGIRNALLVLCNGVIRGYLPMWLENLSLDGGNDPFTKLFKKFAFLKEDDPELGFADLTSLLLLNADNPIEILLTHSGVDCFLDSKPIEEES